MDKQYVSPTRGLIDGFAAKLEEIEEYETDHLMPSVLELTGKLGTLNRMAMHLAQSAMREADELELKRDQGSIEADKDLERLKLELRDTSQRVEKSVLRLKGKLELLSASLTISGEIMDYISRVRRLLTDENVMG